MDVKRVGKTLPQAGPTGAVARFSGGVDRVSDVFSF